MTNERAAKVVDRLERCEFRLDLEPKVCEQKAALAAESAKVVLKLEQDASAASTALLTKQLEAVRVDWWEEPSVVLAAGIVVGIAATIGGVYLLGLLRPTIPAAP